jgi:hypothetical protein
MPWSLASTDDGRLLTVTYQGVFEAPDLRAATLQIVDTLILRGTQRLLLDCYDAHFNVPTADVYQLPELYHARGLSRQVRAAVIMPKDGYHQELFAFYEDVCRNRGYFVQLFPDKDAGLAWLSES